MQNPEHDDDSSLPDLSHLQLPDLSDLSPLPELVSDEERKDIPRTFTIAGHRVSLTPRQVEAAMKDVEPETVRTHVVEVNGIVYPVRQVLEKVTGIDRADFNTHQARRDLKRLGFRVERLPS